MLPWVRLASRSARSLVASTPKVSHSMVAPFFSCQAAVMSPPLPVVAAALCTACATMVSFFSCAKAGRDVAMAVPVNPASVARLVSMVSSRSRWTRPALAVTWQAFAML